MFPIADAQGRIVTYGARAMAPGDTPKYLNGPETAIFKKGKTLYALDRAKDGIRKAGYAILMEGYTDVLHGPHARLHLRGGRMGTAFTNEQARALHTFTEKVVLLYDGDSAGRLRPSSVARRAPRVRGSRCIALLPGGRTWTRCSSRRGRAAVRILDAAKDLFDFKSTCWRDRSI
jgi:DNA primase